MLIGARVAYAAGMAAALVLATTKLDSQTPPANPPPPAVSVLSGIVHAVTGEPLADVDISFLGEAGVTRSDSAGKFTLRGVPLGNHTVLFRRLGFASLEYRWTARASVSPPVTVRMARVTHQLDRVVVEAPGTSRKRGTSSIGGKVTDSTGHAVIGADVRLLGAGLSVLTDSTGGFEFPSLAAGAYIVRVRRRGLASGDAVMQIGAGDDRGIGLKMFGLPKNVGARDTATASGYGAVDAPFDAFDKRERTMPDIRVLGPADLFRANRAALDFVVGKYRGHSAAPARRGPSPSDAPDGTLAGDCLLLNGRRPLYQPLQTFTSLEVLLIEAFPKNSTIDQYVVSQMDALPECRGSIDQHPPYFVLWTRSMP